MNLTRKAESHPLGDFLRPVKVEKEVDLLEMYLSRKHKEEDLKNQPCASRIEDLEREINSLKDETIIEEGDYQNALKSSKQLSEENDFLREELKRAKENEFKYLSKISELERQSNDVISCSSSASPTCVEGVNSKLSRLETATSLMNMERALLESNEMNAKLKREFDKVQKQLNDLLMFQKYNQVHSIRDVVPKETGWMQQMLGRRNSDEKPVSMNVEELLWSDMPISTISRDSHVPTIEEEYSVSQCSHFG